MDMDVVLVRVPQDESSYHSLEEAITATMRGERAEKARRDTMIVEGLHILDGVWNDTMLSFSLSNQTYLTFYLHGIRVDWQVGPVLPEILVEHAKAEDVILVFEDGERYYWSRKGLIASRINRRIRLIYAGTAWVYFYVDNCPILLLSRLINKKTNKSFLYWDNSD
jgi:hypothetical protein